MIALRRTTRADLVEALAALQARMGAARAAHLQELAAAEQRASIAFAALVAARRAVADVEVRHRQAADALDHDRQALEVDLRAWPLPSVTAFLQQVDDWIAAMRRSKHAQPDRDLFEALVAARDRVRALELTAVDDASAAQEIHRLAAPLRTRIDAELSA